MKTDPLVSIITPSFNQAAFLEDTIQSVLGQDYPNLEYIIVDGGSTDNSLAIIEKYAKKISWWVSEPDKGQADAINKGLRRAKGEFVAWLNSDDLYLPGAVTQAAAALRANPDLGLVYGDLQSIDAAGKHFHTIRYRQYSLADLLAFRIIGQPSVFMRRSVLIETELLSLELHYLLDHQLWIQMASRAGIQYFPQEWAAARHHPQAKNTIQAVSFGLEAYEILYWAQEQPDLAKIIDEDSGRAWGGAFRLDARYLLDSGHPQRALKSYWQALAADPGYAIKHWHRIVYALLSVIGLGAMRRLLPGRFKGEWRD